MKWSVVLLNLAAMVEGVDDTLLPAVFAEMSADFGVGLAALGALTFMRSLVQALGAPFAAYWAMRYNRVHIVGIGAICWAISTVLVGISASYWQVILARALNGVSLAIVGPPLMSLVADVNRQEDRGIAFGWLIGAGNAGTMLGGVFATHMGGADRVMGIAGWRAAFFIVAIISLILGIAVFFLCQDPKAGHDYSHIGEGGDDGDSEKEKENKNNKESSVQEFIRGAKLVLKVRTFQVIVAQGIAGGMAGNALIFLTLWMELIGFSHSAAALMVALVPIGSAVGSVFGGWIGDKAASWSANKGRIACSQIGTGAGLVGAAVLFLALPKETKFVFLFGIVMLSIGFLTSWAMPAMSSPIFAEIVPGDLRTTVYAVDLALEKSLAATGAPLAGFIADHAFGFKRLSSGAKIKTDLSNAKAVGNAVFTIVAIPDSLCIIIGSLLYWTYPKDREQAKDIYRSTEEFSALELGEQWEGDDNSSGDKLWEEGWDSMDDGDLNMDVIRKDSA